MEGTRYSRQSYNELNRIQYGGYSRNQNNYILYMKNYYEEYIRRQNKQYLNMKQYYEEYIKNQNKQYVAMMKYYEELIQKQNDNYKSLKIDYEEKLNYYTNIIDNSRNNYLSDSYQDESENSYNEVNIDDNNTANSKDNSYKPSDYTGEDDDLENKDNNLYEYNNLENTCYNDEKDLINNEEKYPINKEVLKVDEEKLLGEDSKDIQFLDQEKDLEKCKIKELEKCKENFIEDNKEEITRYTNSEILEDNGQYLEEDCKENYKEEKDSEHKDYKEENKEIIRCSDSFNKDVLAIKDETFLEAYKDIYVKFPIILAETNIAVTIDDTMKIGRDVKEIRRIKMNAFLKSSNLVPISLKNSESNSGMLFVSGFIRKSIEYATRTYIEEENCGYIKYFIVEVPFNFTTKIIFIRPPVFIENCNVRDDSSFNTNKVYNAHEDSIILCDNCNENFLSTEVFNEKPFVELVKANFIEFNIHKELHLKEDEEIQERYTNFKGNIIVNLRIRVLQEQDLRVEIEKD